MANQRPSVPIIDDQVYNNLLRAGISKEGKYVKEMMINFIWYF